MYVNKSRIIERIEKCASFNDTPGNGISRFSYGTADTEVKQWLMDICRSMNMNISVDAIGNIRARYQGKESGLAPVMIGSHIDSVRNGGKYDGVVGVIGALEVISVMDENEYVPERPIEFVVFAEEEGSNCGTTMVGSKVMTGKLDYDDLKLLKDAEGKSCVDIARSAGLPVGRLESAIISTEDVDSMVELHIEQGIVMEREGKHIGVVQAIAGMVTYRAIVTGQSNHAGGTPMNMRNDPMVAAACLIKEIETVAGSRVNDTTVATVGKISAEPGMSNVIAGHVEFTIDIRDIVRSGIETAEHLIREAAVTISKEHGVEVVLDKIGSNAPISLTSRVVSAITKAASGCTDLWMPINSGAVHDAAMMAGITDVGMIFIPSAAGKSHCPEEYTDPEDIALGTQVLLHTVMNLTGC
ncbi:MAG: M20 family metallo-hydrolase [Lentihominibacter sp.]